jgi:asparagine synthase (glutamine-hydrolysing)
VQYIDVKTYLPCDILVKVDRASMAHSLEVRCPFLDYTLVEWSAGLSTDLKMRGAEGKFVLKKSMEGVLSDDILYRPKMGFGVPVSQWFRGPLRSLLREQVLGQGLTDTGLFSAKALERLVDQHQSGVRDHSAALWALLMFSASMRRLGVSGSA